MCQGKIHIIPLGHLQPHRASHVTFKQDSIASITHCVELPISREVDYEIMGLRCTLEENLRTSFNAEIVCSFYHHGRLTRIFRPLLMQRTVYLHIPLSRCATSYIPSDWQFRERLQLDTSMTWSPQHFFQCVSNMIISNGLTHGSIADK